MLSRYSPIIFLFASMLIMFTGHGLLNTLFGLRASIEGYPAWLVGLMTSGYYIGFAIGTIFAVKVIKSLGNMLTFAICTSIVSASSLALALFVNPISWLILRLLYGLCFAGLYIIIESSLNSFAKNEERGKIFAAYMLTIFSGLAIGQLLITFSTPDKITLFAVASILLSICLIPLAGNHSKETKIKDHKSLGLKQLYRTSPLALFGIFAAGLILGSYWGLIPNFLTQAGFNPNQIAKFIAFILIGALSLQIPIGYLSDRFNRNIVIIFIAILAIISCSLLILKISDGSNEMGYTMLLIAFLIGGSNYSLYPLFMSLLNDLLKKDEILSATSGMLRVNACGAIIGPILSSLSMFIFGYQGFIGFVILIMVSILIFLVIKTVFVGLSSH